MCEYISLNESAKQWAKRILLYNKNVDRSQGVAFAKNAGYDISKEAIKLEKIYIESQENDNN